MTFEMIITILLAGILSHNYALTDFLGTGAVIENHRSKRRSLIIGLGTTLVMVLATLITFPLNKYLLAEVEFLQPLVFVVVILVVVELVHLISKRHLEDYCKVDFLKFAINGAVLGLCIHNTEAKHNLAVLAAGADLTLLSSLLSAFAVGLGLTLTMIVFSSLQSKIDEDAVPESFRGLPISLLIAGMMALAVLAF